jgi:hypothetical protein
MDAWDAGLLAVAGYVAVSSLVRMMHARRAQLVERFRSDLAHERQRRSKEDRQPKKQAERKGTAA